MINDFVLSTVLGLVEGLTEFLPVSSTAHIRLAQGLLAGQASLNDNFWKLYAVAVQLPAVLAVVVYFFDTIARFVKGFFKCRSAGEFLRHPVALVGYATVVTGLPAAAAKHMIKDNLASLKVMGGALVIGGVVMAVVDTIYGRRERRLLSDAQAAEAADQPPDVKTPFDTLDPAAVDPVPPAVPIVTTLSQMKPWQAVWIGAVQVLSAVFPGTSRSMSTIAAGQVANLTRAVALEFSFFVSIPLMFAAFVFDMKNSLTPGKEDYLGHHLTRHEIFLLMTGSLISFVVALAVIAWFMAWVRKRGFMPFAIYRVIIGVIVLAVAMRA